MSEARQIHGAGGRALLGPASTVDPGEALCMSIAASLSAARFELFGLYRLASAVAKLPFGGNSDGVNMNEANQ